MTNGQAPQVVIQQAPTNGLGVAGFVLALLGFLTCGLFSPLGFILSLKGLGKEPRGLAIAGTVLGGLGSGWLFLFGLAIILPFVGLAATEHFDAQQMQTRVTIKKAVDRIDQQPRTPDEGIGNALIVDLRDAWDQNLRYERTNAGGFQVRSAGKDRQFDTTDDLVEVGGH